MRKLLTNSIYIFLNSQVGWISEFLFCKNSVLSHVLARKICSPFSIFTSTIPHLYYVAASAESRNGREARIADWGSLRHRTWPTGLRWFPSSLWPWRGQDMTQIQGVALSDVTSQHHKQLHSRPFAWPSFVGGCSTPAYARFTSSS